MDDFYNSLEEYEINCDDESFPFLNELIQKIEEAFSDIDEKYYPAHLGRENGQKLYCLLKRLKPKVVIETGVCNGFSSAIILKALEDSGKLYSVDLPAIVGEEIPEERTGAVIPPGKESGWAVPLELRKNWYLTIGNTYYRTPALLKEIGEIDVFLHDSGHSYQTMMFEFSIAWEHLRDGGYLLADNIDFSRAFEDFNPNEGIKKYRFGEMGLIVKE